MTVTPELDRRFRAAAASENSLDVRYVLTDSPLGELLVAASARGLCRIAYDPAPDLEVDRLARAFGARVLGTPGALDDVRRQLDEYFEGRRRSFDVALDLTPLAPFGRSVLTELERVGYGNVTTYGALAREAGRPKAARAVGTVMNRNPIPIILPCHRVVGSTGKLVGYAGGLERKETLLRLEGAAM